jgi:hypothetical protein
VLPMDWGRVGLRGMVGFLLLIHSDEPGAYTLAA